MLLGSILTTVCPGLLLAWQPGVSEKKLPYDLDIGFTTWIIRQEVAVVNSASMQLCMALLWDLLIDFNGV